MICAASDANLSVSYFVFTHTNMTETHSTTYHDKLGVYLSHTGHNLFMQQAKEQN